MTEVYMLRAYRTDLPYEFIEIFSSIEKIEAWLEKHPNCVKIEITDHEFDPE